MAVMAKLDKRDIPEIAGIVGVVAVFLAIIIVGGSNLVASLIIAFVAAIVAIAVAKRFPANSYWRLTWFCVAIFFTIEASVTFNEAHPRQHFITVLALLASAAVGVVVAEFVHKADDEKGSFFIPFAFAGITSFFAILIVLTAFISQEAISALEQSILMIVVGLLGLGFLAVVGRGIYYSFRDRWGRDKKRERAAAESDRSSAQNEDDSG